MPADTGREGSLAASEKKMKSCLWCCLWKHFKREEFNIPIIKEETEKKTKSTEVWRRKRTTKPK